MTGASPGASPGAWKYRRVQTPTILQMEGTECGAAALGMVLGHFGRTVGLEELREECGVSRDGSKASDICKAARRYGLTTSARRCDPAGLHQMSLPMIIFWQSRHFLVLEGITRKGYHLNDPAAGSRLVGPDEFRRNYAGIAISFAVGPAFQPGGRRRSTVSALVSRLRPARTPLLAAVLVGLALVVPGLTVSLTSKLFVDHFLVGQSTGVNAELLVAMAAAVAFQGLFTAYQLGLLRRLQQGLSLLHSIRFVLRVLRLPASFHSARSSGDISYRVALNDQIAALLSGQLSTALLGCLTVAFYGIAMVALDPVLAGIGIALSLTNLVVLRVVARTNTNLNRRLLREQTHVQTASVQGVTTIESLKASGLESDFMSRWAGLATSVSNVRQDLVLPAQLVATVPVVLSGLSATCVLGAGALRVMDNSITLGTLTAFQTMLAAFAGPIGSFVALGGQVQQTTSSIERLDDVLMADPDPVVALAAPYTAASGTASPRTAAPGTGTGTGTGHAPRPLVGRVEMRKVTFGYRRLAPPLILDFSLSLAPGQRVAIVGVSGSGKSTIARLVCGLFRPWQGEVRFDGNRLGEIPRTVLSTSIALVDQDVCLFPGTVLDNLTLWDDTVPRVDVVTAAKDAHIHDVIAARPGGYLSQVAERGANFSGGQRQRLEIARALVRNPSILLMDEATSALDPPTEATIEANLRRRGITTIVVAHRLSTVREADEIVVLDRGVVVERGSHHELVTTNGHYARMVAL
ncbi:MAG: NHLP family bacteriocin export ABC transporter peptidase/permease/ATPase subunit [Micromonosporaceae bacterium]|nr:NHLP family bacteriocin export ABC transporter peptidase/permease/ATPase subunit [Micromonosporaceae bacterium]